MENIRQKTILKSSVILVLYYYTYFVYLCTT